MNPYGGVSLSFEICFSVRQLKIKLIWFGQVLRLSITSFGIRVSNVLNDFFSCESQFWVCGRQKYLKYNFECKKLFQVPF